MLENEFIQFKVPEGPYSYACKMRKGDISLVFARLKAEMVRLKIEPIRYRPTVGPFTSDAL